MKKLIMLAMAAALSLGARAVTLPSVGNGTEPNQWTSNLDGVLAAAKTTGYPIFLTLINDTPQGVGCSHCWAFVGNTLNNPEFTRMVNTYKFYLVMINNGGDMSYSDYFLTLYYRYAGTTASGALPLVRILNPSNGAIAAEWMSGYAERSAFWQDVENALKPLCVQDTVLTFSAQSAVNLVAGEAWTGAVERSGASGVSGAVAITLEGAKASEYVAEPSTLSWGASDGTQTFTVKRTVADKRIVSDDITVKIAASGFDGSTVSCPVESIALSFKDSRVGKTLDEFKASSAGLAGLAGGDAVWFSPAKADGRVLETIVQDGAGAKLAFTATVGGFLVVQGAGGSIIANSDSWEAEIGAADATTIGVAPGDAITFNVNGTAGTAGEETIGFAKFEFVPLAVTLEKPADGAEIPFAGLQADKTLADFVWSSASTDERAVYEVFGAVAGASLFSSTPLYTGAAKTLNAVDAGFISVVEPMGDCQWGVRVTDHTADYGTAVGTASATFSISSKPKFADDTPSAVTVYLKAGTQLDFSAMASSSTITYSVKGLPVGMKMDKSTGIITGTPKRAGTYNVVVTAANEWGETTQSVKLSAAKLPASIKGNYYGVFFDAAGAMTGSLSWKIATTGKWSGTLLEGISKTRVKGTVSFDENGQMFLYSSAVNLAPVSGGVLTGVRNGATLYGAKVANPPAPFPGAWTAVLAPAGGDIAAYAYFKMTNRGKLTMKGNINGKGKLSATGATLLLDSATVANCLPEYAKDGFSGTVAFSYGGKRVSRVVVSGGVALYSDGTVAGGYNYGGAYYGVAAGGKWNAPSFASLAGKTVSADGASFGIEVATSTRIRAAANNMRAKISGASKTGVFKGSFTSGAKKKFYGVFYTGVDGTLEGAGTGYATGGGAFPVTVK